MSFSGAFSRLFILNLYFFGRGTTNGLALLKADWYVYIFRCIPLYAQCHRIFQVLFNGENTVKAT